MMKEVLLFSGGMDSFIAWHYLKRPMCLFVDLGHRYADLEEEVCDHLAGLVGMHLIKMRCQEVGQMFERRDAHIPLRNMMLATLGAMHAETVYIVCQEGERSIPDRSVEFFTKASSVLSEASGETRIVDAVFWEMTKVEMVKWYIDQSFPENDLLETFSCFDSEDGKPCAACPACFRRAQAFMLNGIDEGWHLKLAEWEGLRGYRERLDAGQYEGKRAEEMNVVLGRLLGNK